MKDIELYNDSFQNYKVYGLPKAQLIIADVPYNLANNAYASNPAWYRRRQQERRERIGRQTILLVRQRVPSVRVHALLFQNARERTERSR